MSERILSWEEVTALGLLYDATDPGARVPVVLRRQVQVTAAAKDAEYKPLVEALRGILDSEGNVLNMHQRHRAEQALAQLEARKGAK